MSQRIVAYAPEDQFGLTLVDRIWIERCRPGQIDRFRDNPGRKEHPNLPSTRITDQALEGQRANRRKQILERVCRKRSS